MNDQSNKSSQSANTINFPLDDSSTPFTSNPTATSSSNTPPGDVPSPDIPIPPLNDQPTVIPPTTDFSGQGSAPSPAGKSSKKIYATILGLVLLIAGVGTGVYLVGQRQDVSTRAYQCANYVFEVKQDGEVTVRNGSTQIQPSQMATIYIKNAQSESTFTLNVPAVNPGESKTIGRVSVPSNGVFSWRVKGSVDCESSGTFVDDTESLTEDPYCSEVQAYDTQWNSLTPSQLSAKVAGDTVRFSVIGKTAKGKFEAAKFTINSVEQPETTNKRETVFDTYTETEFYLDYVIPTGVNSFDVSAKVKHSISGWF